MPARTIYSWAILSVAFTACGCGSTGVVTRGQDGHAPAHAPAPSQFQTARGPIDQAHDHISGQHTTYYTDGNGMMDQYRQANCQRNGGNCPPQGNYCPPQGFGGACPHGIQGGCRGCNTAGGRAPDWYPQHHKTYSYSVPNDLSYPAQNAVGGAVVYPYYTHKGPSDFFRQK